VRVQVVGRLGQAPREIVLLPGGDGPSGTTRAPRRRAGFRKLRRLTQAPYKEYARNALATDGPKRQTPNAKRAPAARLCRFPPWIILGNADFSKGGVCAPRSVTDCE
jgi:hypothetical protein